MAERVTLITGASKGIGLALARRLAGEGHHVVGLSRTKPDDAPGEFIAVDLLDAAATQAVLDDVTRRHQVDNLVNNAGLSSNLLVEESTLEELEREVAVNIRASLQCTQAVLPAMKAKGRGRIVNTSSRAALGRRRRSVYSMTKAGLIGFTRTWALELAEHGITVNAVAPGPVKTELFLQNHPEGSEQMRQLEATSPMGRFGSPEEIAAAIAFFLSDDASYVTGQVLYACGGLSIGAAAV